jgi:hypothetical protein
MKRLAALVSVALIVAVLPPAARASHEPLDPMTQQAATFALRAIAQAGLFDPLGDYYDYREITSSDDRWVVSFVASHCYRNEQLETCDPYQGRSDHLVPDAWLEIAERDSSFVVTSAFGRFDEEDRKQLLSYSEPSSPEPGHQEYLTVRVDPAQSEGGVEIRAADIWAGVLPDDESLWSICLAEILDASGNVIWTARSRLAHVARGEAFRSGGLLYMGAMEVAPEDAASARISCENFSGETWRTTSEPSVSTVPRRSQVAVTAPVEWLLEGLVTGLESRCEIELFNRAGRMVKAVTKRGPPSPWTRSRLKNNYFHALVRVPHPKRIKSATLYCHEA